MSTASAGALVRQSAQTRRNLVGRLHNRSAGAPVITKLTWKVVGLRQRLGHGQCGRSPTRAAGPADDLGTRRAGRSVCIGGGERGPGGCAAVLTALAAGTRKGPAPRRVAGPFRGGLLAGWRAGATRPATGHRAAGRPSTARPGRGQCRRAALLTAAVLRILTAAATVAAARTRSSANRSCCQGIAGRSRLARNCDGQRGRIGSGRAKRVWCALHNPG